MEPISTWIKQLNMFLYVKNRMNLPTYVCRSFGSWICKKKNLGSWSFDEQPRICRKLLQTLLQNRSKMGLALLENGFKMGLPLLQNGFKMGLENLPSTSKIPATQDSGCLVKQASSTSPAQTQTREKKRKKKSATTGSQKKKNVSRGRVGLRVDGEKLIYLTYQKYYFCQFFVLGYIW